MIPGHDSLDLIEKLAIAEELLSPLRHALRNRFATVRNAAFYIGRRVKGSAVWNDDPRLEQFVHVIDEEMVMANDLIAESELSKKFYERRIDRIRVAASVQLAVDLARIDRSTIRVEIDCGDSEVDADVHELALAVRCLVENAAEAMPTGGLVSVSTYQQQARLLIDVQDEGPGIDEVKQQIGVPSYVSSKPGHAGLGLCIARRIAGRFQGTLVFGSRPKGGASVALSLPGPIQIATDPSPETSEIT